MQLRQIHARLGDNLRLAGTDAHFVYLRPPYVTARFTCGGSTWNSTATCSMPARICSIPRRTNVRQPSMRRLNAAILFCSAASCVSCWAPTWVLLLILCSSSNQNRASYRSILAIGSSLTSISPTPGSWRYMLFAARLPWVWTSSSDAPWTTCGNLLSVC